MELLLTVLDGLPGMVGYWDSELRNVVANRAYLDYFGFTPESMTGRHIRDVLGESVYAANRPFIERALAGEEQLFDRTLVDSDGRTRHTQASYVPHRSDGMVRGFFVLVTDVTERVEAERRAQRSNEQYRALAANVPDGFVLLFDHDLRFLVAGGPELPTFGHQAADLEGRRIAEAFPDWLAAELEPRYRAALTGECVEWERQLRDRTFSLKAGPVSSADGKIFAGMVVAHDITAQHRAQGLQAALQKIATAVARNASPESICRQIARSLLDIFRADTAAVVRFDEPGHGEIVAMAPGRPGSLSRRLVFGSDDWSATAQVAQTGRPALVNYRQQADGVVGALRSEGFVAGAAAPIHHDGTLWGAIALGTQVSDRLTDEVLTELTRFAELVEIALGNVQAWTLLSEQATRDPLTGLHNRRSFDEHLSREIDAARRAREPLSLVAIDIDHFKQINDTHGHPTGDLVLTIVADVLGAAARKSEMVARTGGEEFVWVLPRTTTTSATRAAERARRAIAEYDFGIGPVTISLGVGTATAAHDRDELVAAADAALYDAKVSGRNRICVRRLASPVGPGASPRRPAHSVDPRPLRRTPAEVT